MTLDKRLARRAAMDALAVFIVLLGVQTVAMHRNLQIVPTLAVAAAVFFFRYVMLRRRRDLAALAAEKPRRA